MPNRVVRSIPPYEIARILKYPTIQVERWQSGKVEMLLNPLQMLSLCEELGLTLEQLAEIYCSWGA